jgi:hypothetical protein
VRQRAPQRCGIEHPQRCILRWRRGTYWLWRLGSGDSGLDRRRRQEPRAPPPERGWNFFHGSVGRAGLRCRSYRMGGRAWRGWKVNSTCVVEQRVEELLRENEKASPALGIVEFRWWRRRACVIWWRCSGAVVNIAAISSGHVQCWRDAWSVLTFYRMSSQAGRLRRSRDGIGQRAALSNIKRREETLSQ